MLSWACSRRNWQNRPQEGKEKCFIGLVVELVEQRCYFLKVVGSFPTVSRAFCSPCVGLSLWSGLVIWPVENVLFRFIFLLSFLFNITNSEQLYLILCKDDNTRYMPPQARNRQYHNCTVYWKVKKSFFKKLRWDKSDTSSVAACTLILQQQLTTKDTKFVKTIKPWRVHWWDQEVHLVLENNNTKQEVTKKRPQSHSIAEGPGGCLCPQEILPSWATLCVNLKRVPSSCFCLL